MKLRRRDLLFVGAGAALLVLPAVATGPEVARAWLAAAFLWLGLPLGSIGLMMVGRLSGSRWARVLHPPLVAATLTLPVAALAALLLFLALPQLYPWAAADGAGPRPPVSVAGFVLRTAALLLLLAAAGGLALRRPAGSRGGGAALAAVTLLLLVPLGSIVANDWVVSLDVQFHSSGFGLYALVFDALLAFAAATLLQPSRTADDVRGRAAVMITLCLAWLYLWFSNYFIAWSGNLAPVVPWYAARTAGPWEAALFVVAALTVAPFLLLLWPAVRRSPAGLRGLAAALLLGRAIESAWLVLPGEAPTTAAQVWATVLAMAGLGALFLGAQYAVLTRPRTQPATEPAHE